MNPKNLEIILELNNLSQTDLACLAGVSRQAVSKWFHKAHSMRMTALIRLSHKLSIRLDTLAHFLEQQNFLAPLTPQQQEQIETNLLWDRLFLTLDRFVIALLKNNLRALARLTQVYGLFMASSILGGKSRSTIWTLFHRYKKFLPPMLRQEQEKIWLLQKNLDLI